MNDLAATTQTLIERMQLASDPFAGDNEQFFFVGGQRRFLVQQAVHALYFARGVVLLSGEDGCGKTRIADEVCRELAELADICRLNASVLMDANEIRHRLADVLGLASESAQSGEALLAALDQLKPDEGDPLPVLLAIDDAQQLAVTALADCHRLATASHGRVRLLLIGAPDLLTAWEQTGHFDIDQLDVLPLDAQETADYVSTCLQAAGYRGENPLSDTALDTLYRQSRGNIGEINALAPQLLVDATGGVSSSSIASRLPLPHLAVIAVLIAIIAVAAFFFRSGSSTSAPEPQTQSATTTADGRQAVPLAIPPAQTPVAEDAAPIDTPPAAEVTSSPEPTPAASIAPQPAAPQVVERTPVNEPVAEKVEQAAPEKPAPKVTAELPKESPKPAAIKPAAVSKNAALAEMPSNHFVVQLMAAFDKTKFDGFLARSAKGVRVYTYETRRDGKPWYVAVTGPYATKEDARAAIAALPQALRDQKPWLRPLTSVKADLNARK